MKTIFKKVVSIFKSNESNLTIEETQHLKDMLKKCREIKNGQRKIY